MLPTIDPRDPETFAAFAEAVLTRTRLVAGGSRRRPTEVEVYVRADSHPDPYPHAQDLTRTAARWYFHRTGQSYRGGTYKGLDLTCGGGSWHGALLLRAMTDDAGEAVAGPCRLVNRLLELTGFSSVAELDGEIAGRSAFDPTSPLHVVEVPAEARVIERTKRVGLTMKRATPGSRHADYIAKPYRFVVAKERGRRP